MDDMNIVWLNTKSIKPYEKNAKKHPKEQITQTANSIKRFGWKQPLVVDADNVLVVGHCRWMAAKKLKIAKVPCIMADDLSDEEIKAYRLADNKTNESELDFELLDLELDGLDDMGNLGFDVPKRRKKGEAVESNIDPSCQHNVFENQERMQFPTQSFYGIPDMAPTQTTGEKMVRFMDWKEVDDPSQYIAHFYYDDYKFINAWRNPDVYMDRLKEFKAVVSPDFSLYTDFPRALQILSCYRRQWCGAYWQYRGIDVIPDVVWGDRASFRYCFDGIPKHSTVAVSSVGVRNDSEWNNKDGDLFRAGYMEMMNRLEPTTVLYYGYMIDGLEGNIIQIPSYYAEKRAYLNERKRAKQWGEAAVKHYQQ